MIKFAVIHEIIIPIQLSFIKKDEQLYQKN